MDEAMPVVARYMVGQNWRRGDNPPEAAEGEIYLVIFSTGGGKYQYYDLAKYDEHGWDGESNYIKVVDAWCRLTDPKRITDGLARKDAANKEQAKFEALFPRRQ